MRKLIIGTNKEEQAVLFDVEIEPTEHGGENLRTTYVYRERAATEKEVIAYHSGYGWTLKF
jgi:hypothetical protein